jgi:hypothetical protein
MRAGELLATIAEVIATRLSADQSSEAQAALRAWYLRGLRPKLALAVREHSIDAARALALDQTMRELLHVSARDA